VEEGAQDVIVKRCPAESFYFGRGGGGWEGALVWFVVGVNFGVSLVSVGFDILMLLWDVGWILLVEKVRTLQQIYNRRRV
jgi:hypothetical protein